MHYRNYTRYAEQGEMPFMFIVIQTELRDL